jgi:hypothetical protein
MGKAGDWTEGECPQCLQHKKLLSGKCLACHKANKPPKPEKPVESETPKPSNGNGNHPTLTLIFDTDELKKLHAHVVSHGRCEMRSPEQQALYWIKVCSEVS